MAKTRLVLNVDVQAGNQTASTFAAPGLFGWLDGRNQDQWPTLVRGDCGHGNEEMMAGCEQRNQRYVFRLKRSPGVLKLIAELNRTEKVWANAGQRWEGVSHEGLKLQGWSRGRRVVVLRRRLDKPRQAEPEQNGQLCLPGMEVEHGKGNWYEYGVLVTNWEEKEILSIAQIYRDRADAENVLDELKNQWGWRGYTTKDIKRSELMARMVALFYNWWTIYTRMATGLEHGEAITTRPVLLAGVARETKHANRVQLTIASVHAKAKKIAALLTGTSQWLRQFLEGAEQLTRLARWRKVLCGIFQRFGGFRFNSDAGQPLLASVNCRI